MSLRTQIAADRTGNRILQKRLQDGALTTGTQDQAVKWAERMLELAGFKVGTRDTSYDAGTQAAVKKFQASRGLPVTGELDAKTFESLKKVQTRIRENTKAPVLGTGQAGAKVATVEKRLKALGYDVGQMDDVFDARTAKAVAAFKADQKNLGKSTNIGERAQTALRREVAALNDGITRGRTTKNLKAHRRLDAATAKAAKEGITTGSSKRVVKNVQAHLRAAGFDPKRTDGVFDERTRAALEHFQKKAGLDVTGKVGPRTWNKLDDAMMLAKRSTSPSQSQGERSAAVKRSEQMLKTLGYKVKADGLFDAQTRRAVRAFEKKYKGTGDDGRIGEGQLDRMRALVHAKKDPGSGPGLKKGYRGAPVRTLQRRLAKLGFNPGSADGVFGSKTKRAVKRFQKAFALEADGVVGKNTWRTLGVDAKGKVIKPGAGGVGSLGGVSGAGLGGISAKLVWAAKVARKMGLVVTSTTGGTHAPGSYHYSGRAIDVAGSPSAMARYYRYMAKKSPTELFYDPIGGMKFGQQIGAIGGHSDHVHVAF